MNDATFEDGAEEPLRLKAESSEDLQVLSSFIQDSIGQNSEISWLAKKHRFAMLLNRFRWEDRDNAESQGRPFERVQSTLIVEGCLKITSQGIDPKDKKLVFDLLSISFVPAEDGAGQVLLTLAGDGVIALDVELLDVTLTDVSRPYIARAKDAPRHPED